MLQLLTAPADAALARTYLAASDQLCLVRADVRAVLRECPRADDVLLCTSELAANAILHSDSRKPGGTFTVRVQLRYGSHVLIQVQDSGGTWAEPPDAQNRPHGLEMISQLVTRWGITDTSVGRVVWACLGWSDTSSPASWPPDAPEDLPRVIDRRGHDQPDTTFLDGTRLRQVRHKHGISRERLAHRSGVGITTIARLEQQPRSPVRIRTLYLIATTLGESPTDLIATV